MTARALQHLADRIVELESRAGVPKAPEPAEDEENGPPTWFYQI
jgi:hypothetical protein